MAFRHVQSAIQACCAMCNLPFRLLAAPYLFPESIEFSRLSLSLSCVCVRERERERERERMCVDRAEEEEEAVSAEDTTL